jgi:Ca2+-binding EF-hand superfamily protein
MNIQANFLTSRRMSPLSIGHTRNNTIQIQDFESVSRKVFDALDSDRDGYISREQCNISDIPAALLNILSTLLFQMEDNKMTLNINSFKELCL